MSVITHFLTSDNYIILIKETHHITSFTSRPLELYTNGVVSYAPLNKRQNGDVISKGVQTMEAEVYFYKRRVDRFVTYIPSHFHLSNKQTYNYMYCRTVFCNPPKHTQHYPGTSSNYIQPKPYRICNLTVVICSPYHRKK
jgi:hypothetical protein